LNKTKQGLIIVAMVCIALLVVGAGGTQPIFNPGGLSFGGDSDDGVTYGGDPADPTPYPYPTSDPNAFSITQRSTEEYVYGDYYTPPTSFKSVVNIQPVIIDPGYTPYSHAIGIWGTYDNWNFDVYVQIGGPDAFWFMADSGVTDGDGSGYANIPFFAYDAGQVHTVVAVIDPSGGGVSPVDYGGGFTAGEMAGLIADGTLRASNDLMFDVIAAAIL
jgi:hypothetical protein